jgi:hypothetical protein
MSNVRLCQIPEASDIARRGNPDIQHEWPCFAEAIVAARLQRRAMAHAGNGVCLQDVASIAVRPDFPRLTVDLFRACRPLADAVHTLPLRQHRFRIGRHDGGVGRALPHRNPRPRPLVRRGRPQQKLQVGPGRAAMAAHAVEGFGDGRGAAIGKPGDDRAAGKHLRIGCQHRRRHGAAGGKTGDEDPLAVETMRADSRLDHLADRQCLAAVAADIAWHKPVEAKIGVVGALLLREEHGKTLLGGELAPAGTMIVPGGSLGTAVQHDDQWRVTWQIVGKIEPRAQGARIGPEPRQLRQLVVLALRSTNGPAAHRAQPGDRIGYISQNRYPWRQNDSRARRTCSNIVAAPTITSFDTGFSIWAARYPRGRGWARPGQIRYLRSTDACPNNSARTARNDLNTGSFALTGKKMNEMAAPRAAWRYFPKV